MNKTSDFAALNFQVNVAMGYVLPLTSLTSKKPKVCFDGYPTFSRKTPFQVLPLQGHHRTGAWRLWQQPVELTGWRTSSLQITEHVNPSCSSTLTLSLGLKGIVALPALEPGKNHCQYAKSHCPHDLRCYGWAWGNTWHSPQWYMNKYWCFR